ncbi:class B sortase [Fusibacillus kribbianus]|uniref:Class B sortase n=1 Tax=Fusibacillus kribbianus TaxID=3044208 RepID=A0AAP4B8A3_9FIRM|nr:class B sortase [Ruminococcus sp. YH-rum2234]MDI9241574.1 class B sortase [Ruminococcus sp. YH-rum2234]
MEKKRRFWRMILVLSLVGCICCLGFVAWYLVQDYAAQKQYEEIQETATEPQTEQETEPETYVFTGEIDGEEAELPDNIFKDLENPIDFKSLQDINPELYAWIQIPDTNINYPIAQREGDDEFYLHHDMYQQYRFAGCIYTEDCNSRDFTDPNTVIYGHNMKNKSMFQNLHLFEDKTFFDEHPYVYIYMPDGILVYEIFASYTYDDRHIMNSFDFDDPTVFEEYLNSILHVRAMDANIREAVDVTVDDRIITLETCVGVQTSYRYLVQAVLVSDSRGVSGISE